MATNVEFPSNGDTASGYLALPASGRGPGVLVLQEWWGLDPALKTMADRLAEAGFVALAPDLYRGELAGHDEMDKAAELMNSMPPDRAARDMSGAVDFLVENEATTGATIGVMGFCMGGLLAFLIAAGRGDRISAAVPFYGFPPPEMEPDWTGLTAVVRGHLAGVDDFFAPAAAAALESKLQALGKDVQLTVHEGAGHAFMNPDNSIGNLDEALAAKCWAEATAFLHDRLG
ncbi:MAG TPA: dienelactone hydrolase family protein [Sporichthyaceae bacterium]|jgi:carboxymethylenebutenolidase|nr:dienelactone hydrolase family protein [Sporichthyaceae bacterium]